MRPPIHNNPDENITCCDVIVRGRQLLFSESVIFIFYVLFVTFNLFVVDVLFLTSVIFYNYSYIPKYMLNI